VVGADHVPNLVAGDPVGAHRRAQRDSAVSHDLGGHEADAPDVGVAVFLAEAQALRQVRAHHVAVEHGDVAPALQEKGGEDLRGGGLAGAAQPGEPDAHPLPVPRRVGVHEDLGDLGAGEPVRKLDARVEEFLADLRAGDGGGARLLGHA
jgi:hypothetical protein